MPPTDTDPRGAGAAPRPLRGFTVLYDPGCRACAFAGGWLARQRQLVPLDLVPAGSPEALRRFPALDHRATGREITVVGDGGQVYLGDSAWIVCLWALAEHRELSHTLTTPAGRRLARAAVLGAAKYRQSRQWRPARDGGVRPWGAPPAQKGTAPVWKAAPPVRKAAPRPGHVALGAPLAGPRPAAPRWVHRGDSGWTAADPAAPADPPGHAYDHAYGHGYDPGADPAADVTRGDTGTGPDACADGCPQPG
ncbi:hypothetical protein [Actinacidiphila sp. ITFR-21]|uniref:hypothetical protein n=1 Tax=Actinacidiphila sp. ITFR-21 TaxID=3075199 RepID=UPI0037D9E0A3